MSANQNSTTESAKHTPGPWYLAEDVSGTAFIFCNAGYRSRYIENDSERRANRLLAESAPDLLEELQDILELHDEQIFICGSDDERLAESKLNKVRAVIAKAKGESK